MKTLKLLIHNFFRSTAWKLVLVSYLISIIGGLSWLCYELVLQNNSLVTELDSFSKTKIELDNLKNVDQVVKNTQLNQEIQDIQKAYTEAASLFERRADLATADKKIDIQFAKFLNLLGQSNWREANEQAKVIASEIDKIIVASTPKVSTTVTSVTSNALPNSGYAKQKVKTDRGEFVVSLISAPGASVIVETAGDSDCSDNCPTKTLAEHVSASGGFAGINGAYFCPPDYPKCQGKVNSFDTLAVNGRTKAVLNRANNVYSVVPIMAAYGNNLSFYDQTVQWGVDTSSTGALANHPRLVRDGGVATSDDSGKGVRGFIGKKDNIIVIGHVYSASLADTAAVLVALGIQNAFNLDGGGSTALWYQGAYKAGPGRGLPTAIVLR